MNTSFTFTPLIKRKTSRFSFGKKPWFSYECVKMMRAVSILDVFTIAKNALTMFPVFRVMLKRRGANAQIFRPVVRLATVDVVARLGGLQIPAEFCFQHNPMFKYESIFPGERMARHFQKPISVTAGNSPLPSGMIGAAIVFVPAGAAPLNWASVLFSNVLTAKLTFDRWFRHIQYCGHGGHISQH